MDKKSSNRDRRQERIRQIMQNGREEYYADEAVGADHYRYTASKPDKAEADTEPDPELYWKKGPKPWEVPIIGSGASFSGLSNKRENHVTPPLSARKLFARTFYVQLVVSGILFGLVFGMFKLDLPFAKSGQQVVANALTEQMDFNKIARWYANNFSGAPSFIAGFDNTPSKAKTVTGDIALLTLPPVEGGQVVHTFAETLKGVEILGEPEGNVQASEMGRVILVSNDEKTGKTVAIQHVNQRITIYGKLGAAHVAVNDWVEAGQKIGNLKPVKEGEASMLFFAVQEKGKYVNPEDVVALD